MVAPEVVVLDVHRSTCLGSPAPAGAVLHAGLLAARDGQIGSVAGSAILGCRLVEQDSFCGDLLKQLVTIPAFHVLVGAP